MRQPGTLQFEKASETIPFSLEKQCKVPIVIAVRQVKLETALLGTMERLAQHSD